MGPLLAILVPGRRSRLRLLFHLLEHPKVGMNIYRLLGLR
jgi:hypothetical protein